MSNRLGRATNEQVFAPVMLIGKLLLISLLYGIVHLPDDTFRGVGIAPQTAGGEKKDMHENAQNGQGGENGGQQVRESKMPAGWPLNGAHIASE